MSYRSLKRVLGESSLERKCLTLFGIAMLVLISLSFWWYGSRTEEIVFRRNRDTGRLLVTQALQFEHWEKLESEDFRPLLRNVAEHLPTQEYKARFIVPESSDPTERPADETEMQLLDRFATAPEREEALDEAGAPDPAGDSSAEEDSDDPDDGTARSIEPSYFERLTADGSEYLYYQPVYAQRSCLVCHRALSGAEVSMSAPMVEGDLMAIVQVTIPNGPVQKALNWNLAVLIATAIITAFLAMVASYLIIRYVIVKPLRHLRDVSDAVSHGNISLRADIHTGDEFESLAIAFNRMLRHLVTAQEELREVNTDLDAKVDELAQMNMRLYEMNTIKSDFLATMSHELRTPLNSILGFSDVLGSIDSLDEKQRRYVSNIQQSGRMLLDMINDILDLAKIESGRMDLKLSEFRLDHVVATQCDMARPLAERKNIDLSVHLADDLPQVRQDQARLQQILNNLLSNAVKFTPEGGRIDVAARSEGAMVAIEVADTVVGIAEEDQRVIFDKFRQGRTAVPDGEALTREYSGTGLGLSIVRELCRLLGGDVSVHSELGKGSTFTVRLPQQLEDQPRREPAVDDFEQLSRPPHHLRAELSRSASEKS